MCDGSDAYAGLYFALTMKTGKSGVSNYKGNLLYKLVIHLSCGISRYTFPNYCSEFLIFLHNTDRILIGIFQTSPLPFTIK